MGSIPVSDPLKVQPERTPGSVPTFKVELVHFDDADGSHSALDVTCPRSDCKGWFMVRLVWKVGGFGTRPCPHCFRVSWIPGRENTRPKGKRVVRAKRRKTR